MTYGIYPNSTPEFRTLQKEDGTMVMQVRYLNDAHLTVCHSGSCIIRKEGIEKIVDKNTQPINLKAAEWHEIEALEDGTVFVNVFAEGKY